MRLPTLTLSCLLLFSAITDTSMQSAKAGEEGLFEQQKLSAHVLINLFLDKLDQNGLVLFEHSIYRKDLSPHQVSFVYDIADDSLLVRLCFTLQKKILLPKFEDYYVDKITVETDKDGNIIQVKSHITPLEDYNSK